ncbi:MAG: KUP/HAK/KT family potassium transporter [Candidatus Magnetoovum sp. WYHC-5]|nr:KUP/HAK/KT family potassium transporter [Candidatus Magnetoovum sp. WYHC-5]
MLAINKKWDGIIKSLGVVFGDIGTSPIYTLTVIFLLIKPTEENIIGVLSLVLWTITLLVTVEYAWLAMGLGKKGEGGTIVLRELLVSRLKSTKQIALVTFLAYVGISLIIGDGVITPAISILSAVEGLRLIHGLDSVTDNILLIIASIIAIILFFFQKKGTDKVAKAFGPVMLLWFLCLAVSGTISLFTNLHVLKAINPYYGLAFIFENGIGGFFILAEVILCATGGEALYADMGHIGRQPILRAWYFVCVALLLSYFGQGAFLINHPQTKSVLFEMIFNLSSFLYIPFLFLSIAATVIASQAMISAIFSIVYQGILTNVMPMFKVDFTSSAFRSQIYIGAVNWSMFVAVIFIIFQFEKSEKLASAYGLAVTGTMFLTGIMISWIFYLKNELFKSTIAISVTIVDLIFLIANVYKIPHGGFWSIIIAAFPFIIILIYTKGQKVLYKELQFMDVEHFIKNYKIFYNSCNKIEGTALYFTKLSDRIHPYIVDIMFTNNILYDDNIIVTIVQRDDPFGVTGRYISCLDEGLSVFEIQVGYMEIPDIESLLRENGIEEKTIFYGIEEIQTENFFWQIFSIIRKLTPKFVLFFKLQTFKLHGVVTSVKM